MLIYFVVIFHVRLTAFYALHLCIFWGKGRAQF